MRISFDIDDTLVCGPQTPTESLLPWWIRWKYPEKLRQGTKSLMGQLHSRGCQLWIYTTSYRSPQYLKGWFRALGILIDGVVNQEHHLQKVGRQGPSKYPPAFGIQLHIDDSPGVQEEGQRYGFTVIVVAPDDQNWVSKILRESRIF